MTCQAATRQPRLRRDAIRRHAQATGTRQYNGRVRFTTIFFDVDDTLYPPSSGLWPELKERMSRYMIERLGIPEVEVPRLREAYFRKYGTTLRGLQANHELDTADYLAYVHDVRLTDYIKPDPAQQRVLALLPTRNWIFTNADANHARRVLQTLEIAECFVDIVDVTRMEPYCKPSAEAFALAMQMAGENDPSRCVMIDDLPHTTRAAKRGGFYSLLYGSRIAGDEADAAFTDWRRLPELLDGSPQ
jgi:putative hydrolase of the HAD superfamily